MERAIKLRTGELKLSCEPQKQLIIKIPVKAMTLTSKLAHRYASGLPGEDSLARAAHHHWAAHSQLLCPRVVAILSHMLHLSLQPTYCISLKIIIGRN